jgi:hypothetical protein
VPDLAPLAGMEWNGTALEWQWNGGTGTGGNHISSQIARSVGDCDLTTVVATLRVGHEVHEPRDVSPTVKAKTSECTSEPVRLNE